MNPPTNRRRRPTIRSASLVTALWLAALALSPALASSCPPVLRSVTLEPGENHPTSTWGLPAQVRSEFIQTSRSSEVDQNGYFRQRNVVTFNTLTAAQNTFTDLFEFTPGVYYVHVAGHDSRCNGANCGFFEFSDVLTFEVTGEAVGAAATSTAAPIARAAALNCGDTGGAVTLPSTTGGPGPDRVVPLMLLRFPAEQDVDKLFVRAQMSEPGTLKASARVSVPGASRVYKFKATSRAVGGNALAKLRLSLAKKDLKKVKRALRKGKRLKAKVTVTATDKAKNKRSQKATIRLRD
jgi:hypothetical protein